MLKLALPLTFLAVIVLGWPAASWADETRGTAEQAQALVAKAIDFYDSEGKAALAKISAPDNGFHDRDLYVFVIGPDHKIVARALDPSRIGLDVTEQRDADGHAYGEDFVARASAEGAWVDYRFMDPISGEPLAKSSWLVLHAGYIFGCGIYKL